MSTQNSGQKKPDFIGKATPMGAKVLLIAEKERGLEPDMYISNNIDLGSSPDRKSRIRGFFVEAFGDSWGPRWDAAAAKKQAPNWCAAFASSCYKKAYDGEPVPVKLHASVSAFVKSLGARLVAGGEVFTDERVLRSERPRTPGPGDLVLFRNHAALLRGIEKDGSIHTIEGNTWALTDKKNPQRHVWGIHQKVYHPDTHKGRWEGLHFGLIVSE